MLLSVKGFRIKNPLFLSPTLVSSPTVSFPTQRIYCHVATAQLIPIIFPYNSTTLSFFLQLRHPFQQCPSSIPTNNFTSTSSQQIYPPQKNHHTASHITPLFRIVDTYITYNLSKHPHFKDPPTTNDKSINSKLNNTQLKQTQEFPFNPKISKPTKESTKSLPHALPISPNPQSAIQTMKPVNP